jgi:hypothetical protein
VAISQSSADPDTGMKARLVFVDETWIKTNMMRTHTRAPVASGRSARYQMAIGRAAPSSLP